MEQRTSPAQRNPWALVGVLSIAGALVVSLIVLAFLWPGKTANAKDLPVAIAGPTQSVAATQDMLDQNAPGTFEFVAAADRGDAVSLIESREVYGAIILAAPPAAPEVLIASAGSTAVGQMLTGFAGQLEAQRAADLAAENQDPTQATVAVTDVVPLSDNDPTGSGLAAVAFPLTMGGLMGGVLAGVVVQGAARRVTALTSFALLTGGALTIILRNWFGYLPGDFWLTAAALSMSIFSIATFVAGFASLLGRVGLVLAAMFSMLVANPLAAAATPWQFLAAPWGEIGQHLTPGAANSLLRSVSYFPEAPTAQQWWVLAAWAAVGLALVGVAGLRREAIGANADRA